jgi:HSP20 family protein
MTSSLQRSAPGETDRWHPLRQFENLYNEMDRLAQSVFVSLTGEGAWMPAADIVETDSAYNIEVELPGVRPEDADITLNGNELVVKGEVKEREREGLFRRRTRRVGEFELRVTLPGPLRESDAEASLAYGVLKVHVPKAESTKSSKITVSEPSGESP